MLRLKAEAGDPEELLRRNIAAFRMSLWREKLQVRHSCESAPWCCMSATVRILWNDSSGAEATRRCQRWIQMLPVAASRLLLKHLPMLLAQGREAG